MNVKRTTTRLGASLLGIGLLLFPFPGLANATSYVFDLSGTSAAPLAVPHSAGPNFLVNWTGAVLTYNDFGTADDFSDDLINLSGAVEGCFGTTACGSTVPFGLQRGPRLFSTYFGGTRGLFTLDATIAVDSTLTTGYDNVYAQQQANIGTLELPNQTIFPVSEINLGLMNNADLGWAFHLFDENPRGDNQFRIETWLTLSGFLLGGAELRFESRPVERVFNGDIIATLRGTPLPPTEPPPTEVPEPGTLALLLAGVAGLRKRRSSIKSCS